MLNRRLKELEGERKDVTEEIADEIVDLLLESSPSKKSDVIERKLLGDIVKLEQRVFSLENRVEKFIKNFKISAVESERHISETSEELTKENEQNIMNLQAQMDELRATMIRLSSRIKKIAPE